MKFALVLILALLFAGCSDKLPETGTEPTNIPNESVPVLGKYKIEPIGAEGDVAVCFELEIENEGFDQNRGSDRVWSLKIPAIISDKPGAAALNEKIYKKYTSKSDRELTAREYFDLCTGGEVTLVECAAQFSRLVAPTSEDDLISAAPYGEYVIVTFSQGTMYFNRTIPYPEPSELPAGEPICEGKAFASRVSFRIYADQSEPNFYWSDDGSTWFRYILPLPEGCESGRVIDCGGDAGSGEGIIYLEADSGGAKKYFAYLSYTHVLPLTFSEPYEIGAGGLPNR